MRSSVDADLLYASNQLDRDVVAKDQIRTVIRTFRERLFTEIFPGRTEIPKTLIFAKDDSHADDIVQIVREEFAKGNDFAQKITYRTGLARVVKKVKQEDGAEIEEITYVNSGQNPEDLLSSFRNSYNPRVVVTVDMIATGTDVKPLEVVFFMRDVRSLNYFEQMKGRGVRVISETDFQAVTPDARSKTHFVLVDAVGLCTESMVDSKPLERQPTVSFEKILEAVAFGNRDKDLLSSLASRLVRLDRRLTKEDRAAVESIAGGKSLSALANAIVHALDPDVQIDKARQEHQAAEPTTEQVQATTLKLLADAAKPIASNAALRNKLIAIKKSYEQTIDAISKDEVLEAGYSADAKEKAKTLISSFEEFIRDNKDEITALQVLYGKPFKQRLTFTQVKELADAIQKPHPAWTPENLWRAYETLDRSKVRGSGQRVLTDLVSLVRFALGAEGQLKPFPERVHERFELWLAEQEGLGKTFTDEQRQWLEAICEHVGSSLEIDVEDFEYTPFAQRGGVGKAAQIFGAELPTLLKELGEVLAA
jgi:type I restriction enzyme R subunit